MFEGGKNLIKYGIWKLMNNIYEPCKKCDMDSHGNSMSFLPSQLDLVAVWSKSTPNSMTIPCHLSRVYLFSMLEHDMDFGQVQVMECPRHLLRKWWDFPCGFGLIFEPNQTAVKKIWENIKCHIFYRVVVLFMIVDSLSICLVLFKAA